MFVSQHIGSCHITNYRNTALYRISSNPIQAVMLYKTTLYVIISPILSLSQLLQCLDLQLMLLQNKRCRGVKWVKDWEDYLGLCCCQPLSLTHSVRVAIWQLYSTASLSSERKKRQKKKRKGKERGGPRTSQDYGLREHHSQKTGQRLSKAKKMIQEIANCAMNLLLTPTL